MERNSKPVVSESVPVPKEPMNPMVPTLPPKERGEIVLGKLRGPIVIKNVNVGSKGIQIRPKKTVGTLGKGLNNA